MSIAWTLGDIMSAATAALGNRTDITASRASFWANQSQQELWNLAPHDEAEALAISSTTSGEDKLTLPSDFEEMLSLSLVTFAGSSTTFDNDVLDQINLMERETLSAQTGQPTKYLPYATWLELWPTPDSAYSLQMRYRKKLSTMTATTALPSVSTPLRQGIYLKTTAYLARENLDMERYQSFENDFIRFVSRVPNDRARRMRENHYASVSIPRRRP